MNSKHANICIKKVKTCLSGIPGKQKVLDSRKSLNYDNLPPSFGIFCKVPFHTVFLVVLLSSHQQNKRSINLVSKKIEKCFQYLDDFFTAKICCQVTLKYNFWLIELYS